MKGIKTCTRHPGEMDGIFEATTAPQ